MSIFERFETARPTLITQGSMFVVDKMSRFIHAQISQNRLSEFDYYLLVGTKKATPIEIFGFQIWLQFPKIYNTVHIFVEC